MVNHYEGKAKVFADNCRNNKSNPLQAQQVAMKKGERMAKAKAKPAAPAKKKKK